MLYYVNTVIIGFIVNSTNLTNEQFNKYSSTEEDWFCKTCLNNLFPFGDLTDEELCFNMSDVDDNLIELCEQCTHLNYVSFTYSDKIITL